MHQNKYTNQHIPVLLEAVLEYLNPKPGDRYLDLTAGYGGHARAVLERTLQPESATLIDRDQNAVTSLQMTLNGKAEIIHEDFYHAAESLLESGRTYDCILADLGVSSPHLNEASRGFSIAQDGPLDMRMDQTQTLTAEKIVNSYSEAELSVILRDLGEEPKSSAIAKRIVAARPITSTRQLAVIVAKAWPGRSKVHPATRTFQALRIAVNDELHLLQSALPIWMRLLAPGGRLAVISFHSLEDRIVKQFFAEHAGNRFDSTLELLTKKPILATAEEIAFNPRSRSAKLRAAVKK